MIIAYEASVIACPAALISHSTQLRRDRLSSSESTTTSFFTTVRRFNRLLRVHPATLQLSNRGCHR